jgi:hypothetical protein
VHESEWRLSAINLHKREASALRLDVARGFPGLDRPHPPLDFRDKTRIVWTADGAVECMERQCLVWLLVEAMAHMIKLQISRPSRMNAIDHIHQIPALLLTGERV